MTATVSPFESMPRVGYRFHPTDEEICKHYLWRKRLGDDSQVSAIAEVNVCNYDPWDLPDKSTVKSGDQVWYFFCLRDFKYLRSQRKNRKTVAGFWKPTGKTRNVKTRRNHEVIGTKKTLVFYKDGYPKPVKTSWVMHEYNPGSNFPDKRDYVLFCLKKKFDEKVIVSTSEEGETSHQTMCGSENQKPDEMTDISTYEVGEISHGVASDSEVQRPDEMTDISTCEEVEPSQHMAFDFENQISEQTSGISTNNEGEPSYSVTSESEGYAEAGVGKIPEVDREQLARLENLLFHSDEWDCTLDSGMASQIYSKLGLFYDGFSACLWT